MSATAGHDESGGVAKPMGRVWIAALLIAATLVVYWPTLSAGFVWDDDKFVTENPLIHASDGLRRFWFTTEAPDYFPLTSTTLWLEWRLWGHSAPGFHATNIALHAISAVLLWLILARLRVPGAWLAALLFAVHPVNVESVAWVTERKNTLSLVLGLASLLLYLRADEGAKRGAYWGSVALFALALLSKTMVAPLPFVLLLCAWWQRGKVAREDLTRALPFFVVAAALSVATLWFQHTRAIAGDVVRTDGFLSRLMFSGWASWFYLAKVLWPAGLCFVYPRVFPDTAQLINWWPLLAGLCVLAAAYCRRETWGRPLLMAGAVFVLMLLPILGFINIYFMKYSLVADHWQYAAMIAPVALFTGACVTLASRRGRVAQRAATVALLLLAALLGAMSVRHVRDRDSERTLWVRTLARNPDAWIAHAHLGTICRNEGDAEGALRHYLRAVAIEPNEPGNQFNLGLSYYGRRNYPMAEQHFRKALDRNPDLPTAQVNLARTLVLQGKGAEGVGVYQEVLSRHPDSVVAMIGIARVRGSDPNPANRKAEEALEYAKRAVRATGGENALALDVLGAAYAEAGDFDKAVACAELALAAAQKTAEAPPTAELQRRLERYRRHEAYREPR